MDEFGLAPPERKKKPLSGDLSEFAGPVAGLEGYEASPFANVSPKQPIVKPFAAEAISTEQKMNQANTWLDKFVGGKPKTLALWGAMSMGFKPTKMVDGKMRLAEAGSTKELDAAPDWLKRVIGHEKGKTKFIPGVELNKEDLAEFRRIETVWKAQRDSGQAEEFIEWLRLWAAIALALWTGGQVAQQALAYRALLPPGMRLGPQTFQRLVAKVTTPLKYKGLGTIRGGATTRLLESPLLPHPQQYVQKGPPSNPLESWIMTISRGQVPTAHPYIGQFRSPIKPPIVQQMSKVELTKFSISAQDLVSKLGYKLSPELIQNVVTLAAKVSTTKPMAHYTMTRLAQMLSTPETAEATRNAMAGLMGVLSKPKPLPGQGQQKLVEVQPKVPERRAEIPPTAAEVARAGKEELAPDWLFSKEKPTEQLRIEEPASQEIVTPVKPAPTVAPARPIISDKARGRANKFHDLAAGLQKQIDTKLRPAISDQPLTTRRARIAAGMSADAAHLRQVQAKLNAVADGIEQKTLPKSLRGIKNKKQIEFLHSVTKYEHEYPKHKPGEYGHIKESVDRDLKTLASMDIDSERAFEQAKKDFGDLKAEVVPSEAEGAGRIRRMEMDLIDRKIPGFFVTPRPVIDQMIASANIEPGMSVLEPSAGKGDIADAIKATQPGVEVSTAEISSQLRSILEAKGHKIVGQDIFEHAGKYDRIIANPPFEKGQDVDHVKHYWNLLKPGGRMTVIMGEHPFFASDKKSVAFREWLESIGGTSEQLPPKSFTGKESFRQTGVAARVVTIDKPSKTVSAPAEARAVPTEKGKVPSKRLVKLQKELGEIRQKINTVLGVHTEMLAEQFLEAPKGKRYPVYTDEEVGPGDLIEWRGEKSMRHEFLRDYTTKQVREALKKRKGAVWDGIKTVARQELLEGGESLEGRFPPDPQFADLLGRAYELSEQILAIEQPEAVLSDEVVKLYGGFGIVSGSPFLRLPADVEATINEGAKATFRGAKDAVMRFFLKYESLRQINRDAAKRFAALEYGAFQTEQQAIDWVKNIQKTYNVKDNQLAALADVVELGKRQPAIYETVPDNVQKAAQTIIALNEWLLAELKKRPGIYPGRFPDGQIKAFQGKIKVAQEKIARLRRDFNGPTATGKEAGRIQKLAEKIAKYNLGITRFKDLRYLHHLVLHDKINMNSITRIVEKGLRALKPSKYTIGVGRKIGTVRELDQLGIPHEKNPIVSTAHHLFVSLREIRKYDFLEQFKQDIDLVRRVGSPEVEENKTDFSTIADLPQFKDYVVHEALIQAMREYAAPGQETKFTRAWLKFTNIVKQIKFYLPHIMVLNNLQQGILTGSVLPIHFRTGPKGLIPGHDAILLARRSWQMHLHQSEEYKAIQTLGLFSRAVDWEGNALLDLRAAFEGAEGRSAKMVVEGWFGVKFDKAFWDGLIRQAPVRAVLGGAVGFASGVFTGSSIPGAIVGAGLAVAPKEFYHALRHLTWTMDRIQRVMSYLHYRRQGLNIEDAVTKAKTVHADYDMLRAPLSKALTALLLTPKYKAAMLKLHKDMLISLGPKGFRSELSGTDTPAFRGELARLAMYKALFILALGLNGWRLTQWYRATKQEPGDEEERVHVAYGPVWEPEKYLGRLRVGEPIRDVGDFATRILNTIYPYTAVAPHVAWSIQRKRDWKGDKIWSKGQPAWEQIARITAFAVREILAPLSMAEIMSEEERTVGQNILALCLVSIYKRNKMQGYMGGRMRAEARILKTLNKQDEEAGELTDELRADRERDLDEWLVSQTKRILETEYRQKMMDDTSKGYFERMGRAYGITPSISDKEIRARMKELMKTPKRRKRKKPSLIKKYGLPAPGG